MAKKEYRNSLKSQRAIKEAVVSLLAKKKDFYSITVSDVCIQANINRGTFYNHYANIGEAANAIEDDLMTKMMMDWQTSRSPDAHIANFIGLVTAKLAENEASYRLLIGYIPEYFFDDMKARFLGEIEPEFSKNGHLSDYSKATMEILASGITSLYLSYFQHRTDMSLKDIGSCCIEVVNKVLATK
jgi:hypothetical protein